MGRLLLDPLTCAVSVHVTFDLPAVHKDTELVVPNQTGSAVKTKQPIRGDVYQSVGAWIKLRMIRGQEVALSWSWRNF